MSWLCSERCRCRVDLHVVADVFQGILYSTPDCVPDHSALVRLWIHEATRVYHDKLVDDPDRDMYKKLLMDAVKKIEVSFDSIESLASVKR